MHNKLNVSGLWLSFIIFVSFFVSGNSIANAGDACSVIVRKDQNSNRTVFLAGGNAWNLFERYLSETAKQHIDLPLWKIHVVVSNGKERKEFSLSWKDMLAGQGAKERWEGRLKNIKAEFDESVLNDANQQGWDIICINSENAKITPVNPPVEEIKKPNNPQISSQNVIPAEAKQNFQQGLQFAARRDFNNAIKEFTAAIQKDPSYAIAYSNRGAAYMQQKKFNIAEDDMKKASELSPNDPIVNYNLMTLYSLQKGKFDRALNYLDLALTNGFNDYDALRKDPDLENLRKHPEWRKILEKHKIFLETK